MTNSILRYDYEPFSLQENLFHRTNMEMNIIMDDTSSLPYGCLVHNYCLLYISMHRGYTSNFTEGKWFSQGVFTWREGTQASQLTHAMGKGSFYIVLFKTQRFFMLDKCIPKLKINPVRSSGSFIAYMWN